jgi:hypothetical protein
MWIRPGPTRAEFALLARSQAQVGHHTACTSLRVGSLIVTTVDDPAIRDEKCSILHIEFGLLLKYRAISLIMALRWALECSGRLVTTVVAPPPFRILETHRISSHC